MVNASVRKAAITGVLAIAVMLAVYLGILTLAESWGHALELLREEVVFVGSLAGGFGIQMGLYTYLKSAVKNAGRHAGMITGISGGSSSASMVACCVHHVTDLLPLIGVSAAATFLGRYRSWLMVGALMLNLAGIAMLVYQLARHRHAIHLAVQTAIQQSDKGFSQ
ncbi:MAG: hypothetical protein P1S60_04925 [Anaerolineae bacterium]|nr:hypothetical protein [Anaerolineae bacterium]